MSAYNNVSESLASENGQSQATRSHFPRMVVRSTTEAYLHPDFDLLDPPSIHTLATDEGIELDEQAALKVDRYSLAAAAIHLMMDNAIQGEGSQAHFINADPTREYSNDNPLLHLQNDVLGLVRACGDKLHKSHRSFAYIMDRFVELSEDDDAAIKTEDGILDGGDLPADGAQLVGVTANATEIGLGPDASSDRRLAIAHSLTHIVTGRASKHLDVFTYALPSWTNEITRGVELVFRGQGYNLTHPDGSPLFKVITSKLEGVRLAGPALKCPAHQQLFGRHYTALEQGLHATINLAAQHELYS